MKSFIEQEQERFEERFGWKKHFPKGSDEENDNKTIHISGKSIKSFIAEHDQRLLKHLEEEVEKKIEIHKQLAKEYVGGLEEIAHNIKTNNPHPFVVEQLQDILTLLRGE